jgi:hypothetical protein
MFDAKRFLTERNHPFKMSGAEISSGWLGILCPICGDTSGSTHGAFSLKNGAYNCWRCGGTHPIKVIQELESCSYKKAKEIYNLYQTEEIFEEELITLADDIDIAKLTSASKMQWYHRDYLEKRNFDSEKLEREYKLLGTGPTGNYRFSIVAPIIYQKREVSFQARDITDKNPSRYKPCRKENEVIHYKDILYNCDKIRKNIVIVEGISDVWRIGPGAIATFGVRFTKKQLILVLTLAQRSATIIYVCFDPELEAQKRARKLTHILKSIHKESYNISLSDTEDPGTMSEADAISFRREFGL